MEMMMYKDIYFDAPTATTTLTPTKLLLESNQPDLFMNEINPFDHTILNSKLDMPMSQPPLYYPPPPPQQQQQQQQRQQEEEEEEEESVVEDQPKKQRKRLLEKNREAAYRCRQKKKKYVHDLEEHSKSLEDKNTDLQQEVIRLKEESIYLRNLILTHGNCDCQGMQSYLRRTSQQLSSISMPLPPIDSSVSSSSSISSFIK